MNETTPAAAAIVAPVPPVTPAIPSTDTADSLSRHRSVWEMRADGWIGLVDDLGRVATLPRDNAERETRMRRINATLAALAPIESFWAFPGRRVFTELFIPGATQEQGRWFDDLMRITSEPAIARRVLAGSPDKRLRKARRRFARPGHRARARPRPHWTFNYRSDYPAAGLRSGAATTEPS